MKILYIDYGNVVNDAHMYQYYGDLFRELRQLSQVYLFHGVPTNINALLEQINVEIDCIIFGLGYFAQSSMAFYRKIEGLDNFQKPIVCMIHKPQTMLEEKLEFCKINNVDLILDSQCTYKNIQERTGIRTIRSPFTATPKYYYPRDVPKKYDIGFCGALHGNGKISGPTKDLRVRARDALLDIDGLDIYWNSSNTLDYRISSVEEYATRINECKFWLATTGPTEDVSPRYFEVMLSKTLLFCNHMPEQYENMFIDGFNCVTFKNDLSDFSEKLIYYLTNEQKANKIIENAYNIALKNYTWEKMAVSLIGEISDLIKVI